MSELESFLLENDRSYWKILNPELDDKDYSDEEIVFELYGE